MTYAFMHCHIVKLNNRINKTIDIDVTSISVFI